MATFLFFFPLDITESWGNFVMSHIKKRTSDVTQHLLNMNMCKEQYLPSHPFSKEGRILLCFKVTDFGVRECV